MDLPFDTVEAVRAAYAFSNLQDFLDIYYQGAAVLKTEADFRDLALAYFRRLHADGGVHAEIFFDPQTHTARGTPFAAVAEGLLAGMEEARRTYGVTSKLILCFLRHLDESAAFAALHEGRAVAGSQRRGGPGSSGGSAIRPRSLSACSPRRRAPGAQACRPCRRRGSAGLCVAGARPAGRGSHRPRQPGAGG